MGLATEREVLNLNNEVQSCIEQAGGPSLDAFYFCPNHPNATLLKYRIECNCRKPRPGLFLRSAQEYNLDLRSSFAIGDLITDIIVGARAGCRTILMQTDAHLVPPIQTSEPLNMSIRPDYTCADLVKGARWIFELI